MAAAAMAVMTTSAAAQWHAEVEISPLDGANPVLYVSLDAVKRAGTPVHTIMIRCRSREISILFDASAPLKAELEELIWLRIKYDDAEPISLNARRSTNLQSVLLYAAKDQLAEFLKTKRTLIEYTPLGGGRKLADFKTSGLDLHLPLLKQHCGL